MSVRQDSALVARLMSSGWLKLHGQRRLRPWRAADKRSEARHQRQFAAGVGPRRQWKTVDRCRGSDWRRPSSPTGRCCRRPLMQAITETNLATAFYDEQAVSTRRSRTTSARSLCGPDYAPAYNNMGAALRAKGRVTEAIAALRESTRDPARLPRHALQPRQRAARLEPAAGSRRALPIAPDARFRLGRERREQPRHRARRRREDGRGGRGVQARCRGGAGISECPSQPRRRADLAGSPRKA